MSFRPIIEPTRPAGLYLRDTWQPRLGRLAVAVVALCFAAVLLGVAIMCVMLSIAAITHDYITWGLALDLLVAVATGAGTFLAGRAFIEEGWAAVRPLPAIYPEPATGAIPRSEPFQPWPDR